MTLLVLSLMMGATYLTLKTTGELQARCQQATTVIGVVAILVTFGFMTWIHVGLGTGFVPKPVEALALMAVVAAAWLAWAKAEGWAFTAAAVGIGGTVASLFQELFPRVMISSTNASYNLTVDNTASPSYTLKVMTVVAVIFFPVVLAYQAWGYHVFRATPLGPQGGRRRKSAQPSNPVAPSRGLSPLRVPGCSA